MTHPPEYRDCPVTGATVLFAPERAARPHPPEVEAGPPAEAEVCPFCPGQEHDTTAELFALRDPGTLPNAPGWRLRVIPNKFPAVRPDSAEPPAIESRFGPPRPGNGVHELVIECPEHFTDPTQLSHDALAAVWLCYRDRLRELSRRPEIGAVTVFKNVGAAAGASLAHAHSQIVATTTVPGATAREWATTRDYFRQHETCALCDHLAEAERLVAETEHFALVCPYAPRVPHEFWLLPREHQTHYADLPAARVAELARLVRDGLTRLTKVLPNPAYNWFIQTGPPRTPDSPWYHWRVVILPRTTRLAGFEWAGGMLINAVPPEASAAALRGAG